MAVLSILKSEPGLRLTCDIKQMRNQLIVKRMASGSMNGKNSFKMIG